MAVRGGGRTPATSLETIVAHVTAAADDDTIVVEAGIATKASTSRGA